MSDSVISLRGVRVNNLRDVDLDLPRRRLIVVCGVSGSGKTSLALDTLYAEGQRRYIESFSAYTRQFLEQLDKPEADSISGIPPAIAVTHKNPTRSNRATVGTATEINNHLALLYARIGELVCYGCGKPVHRDTPERIVQSLAELPEGTRMMLGFDVHVPADQPVDVGLTDLAEAGYVRAVVGAQTVALEPDLSASLRGGDDLTVIVDRLTAGVAQERLHDSLETALAAGRGHCVALVAADESPGGGSTRIDGRPWQRQAFSSALRCETCGIDYPDAQPSLFNFNSPLGACPVCEGFGNVVETDMDRVVPDRRKTLREGAIAPWNTPAYAHELEELLALADDYDIPVDVPFAELNDQHLRLIREGVAERNFGGLRGFFQWLERRKYKMHLRVFLSRWRSYVPCSACGGARLRPEALAVRVGGRNLGELARMEIRESLSFLESLELADWQRQIASRLLEDVVARLAFLVDAGVDYLTLDRPLRTLSGGEAQRVALTTTLGSNLVDMLYVLDEPSIGLHPANVEALGEAIARLRDRGNTVVVVEHEEEVIRRADEVVEIGPGAGTDGGNIVFQGPPEELTQCAHSRTGDWLAGRWSLPNPDNRRQPDRGAVRLTGARGYNLKSIDVEFPLGVLCLVTGVSGAGKSTLVHETLYPALYQRLAQEGSKSSIDPPLEFDDLLGSAPLDDVVLIDPSPIGRSPRSNPVTYVKAFDPIRSLFAEQSEARSRGYTAGHFSFNVDGGRCEACQGDGYKQIDMQFMADVYMRCGQCDGRRYRREVLDVKYRGRDIAEVLDMTVREAFTFFRGQQKIQAKLKCLLDVGLDYLRLGQPATNLSGGEAQRLKLATYLAGRRRGRTLFVLDEPTTGLHFSDITKLLDAFDSLLDVGHSLVIVEHNLQLMAAADWLIDLGPGASAQGGQIVATGTPEQVAECEGSVTGRFLRELFARHMAARTA